MRDSDQLVAIKIIPVGQHSEQAAIQKEIDMLKECEHPNIVRYMVRGSFVCSLLDHCWSAQQCSCF